MAIPAGLLAGAARADITPERDALPAPYRQIGDRLHARVLLLDNGTQRVVLATVDAPTIAEEAAGDLKQRVGATLEVPVENILLGGTHSHNSIRVAPGNEMRNTTVSLPGSDEFLELAVAGVLRAAEQARGSLRPARLGYATGSAALIGNRNQWLPQQHRYIEGVDRTRREPIDQRLGVLAVEAPDGRPIAFVLNYGIEPVLTMPLHETLSGDVPGATSQYVEARFNDGVVALFTVGSCGNAYYRAEPSTPHGGADPRALVSAMATILGEEAIAVAADTRMEASEVTLCGSAAVFECPGKITTPLNWPGHCDCSADPTVAPPTFSDQDGPSVPVSMGLLRIGDLAIVEVDANVSPAVWLRLAAQSPFSKTMLASLAYGPIHYVVSDADYPLNTYEATASMAKMGHAEESFIETAMTMLTEALVEPATGS